MIPALHLLWIIPVACSVGYLLHGMLHCVDAYSRAVGPDDGETPFEVLSETYSVVDSVPDGNEEELKAGQKESNGKSRPRAN